MPAAPIDVDPDVYLSAGDLFLAVNGTVCDLVADAATAAGAGGGMAGTDSSGVSWAGSYDAAAADALTTGATLADALGRVGQLLSASAANHADADAASVPGGPPSYPGGGAGRGAAAVLPATPPSADGTPGDPPHGWFLIAHLLQYTWPNGHQDQLRTVAAGWRRAATEFDGQADRLTRAVTDLAGLTSPEVAAAVETCAGVQQSARDLSTAFVTLGNSCSDYAARLDEAHSEVRRELAVFAAESAVIQIVGAVAAGPTAGGGEAAGQVVQGARAAATATKVSRVLAQLIEFVRAATGAVRMVIARIAEVAGRLKVVLGKGVSTGLEKVAPQLRPDWPQLSGMLRQAGRGKGMFGVGTATREQADAVGMAWVGPGAKLASDGKTWLSADGLRQYRPPVWKPQQGRIQANLERREVPRGPWPHNAHVDVEG